MTPHVVMVQIRHRGGRATASLTVLAMAALLAAACGGPGGDVDPGQGSAADRPAGDTTSLPPRSEPVAVAPSTTVPLPTVALERVDHGEWAGRGVMHAVTPAETGLVAVGTVEGETLDGAAWTSTDGLAWAAVAGGPGVFDDGDRDAPVDQVVLDVASGAKGIVAVGYEGGPSQHDGAVWTWLAGADWARVADAAFTGDGVQQLRAVAHTTERVVVVGESAGQAAAWSSTTGVDAWDEAPVSGPPSDGAGDRTSVMNDVAVGDVGLVAVGQAASGAAVWLSLDGTVWSQVPELGIEGQGVLRRVIALTGGGVLAVGDLGAAPLVMTSPDGFEWRVLDARFVVGTPAAGQEGPYAYLKRSAPLSLTDLWPLEDRIVAVGRYAIAPSAMAVPEFITLWVSPDGGATWLESGEAVMEASDSQLGRGAHGMAIRSGRVVLVGSGDEPTHQHEAGWWYYAPTAAVWTSPAP